MGNLQQKGSATQELHAPLTHTLDGRLSSDHEWTIEPVRGRNSHIIHVSKCTMGIKPCLIFSGDEFQHNPHYVRAKNLLIDFFRGEEVDSVRLQGLELVISFSFFQGCLHVRTYRILLKKSGTRTPRIELEEIGPRLRLTLRRSRLASDDLMKSALKQPKQLNARPPKNVSHDALGTRLARVHVGKQNLQQLQTRKLKGLKRDRSRKRMTEDNSDPGIPSKRQLLLNS